MRRQECFTGEQPWAKLMSPIQVIFALTINQERPPLPDCVPQGLRALICACWAEEPAERPPFTAVHETLVQLRHQLDGSASAPVGRRASHAIHSTL